MPEEDVFISATYAEEIVERTDGNGRDLFRAREIRLVIPVGAGGIETELPIYYTIYRRKPRPGPLQLRILLRTPDGSIATVFHSEPIESLGVDKVSGHRATIPLTIGLERRYLCFEADGVDRLVMPLVVQLE